MPEHIAKIFADYGVTSDSFRQFCEEEKNESGDRELEKVKDDLAECRRSVNGGWHPFDKEAFHTSHPWFTDAQAEILKTYLNGEFSHALIEADRESAMNIITEDKMLACMVAACDQRFKMNQALAVFDDMENVRQEVAGQELSPHL